MTNRKFFLSANDKIKTAEPAEIKIIRFVGAGMIEVELKSDGDIEIEEHDPIREAVEAEAWLDMDRDAAFGKDLKCYP